MHELIRLIGVLIGSDNFVGTNIISKRNKVYQYLISMFIIVTISFRYLPQYGFTLGILVFDAFHKFILHHGLYYEICNLT